MKFLFLIELIIKKNSNTFFYFFVSNNKNIFEKKWLFNEIFTMEKN